jgi:hypothetical protein
MPHSQHWPLQIKANTKEIFKKKLRELSNSQHHPLAQEDPKGRKKKD